MGSTELLSWKDHHQTLLAIFKTLLHEKQLFDCTIAAEGQYLKAHKLVLCASSPYFQVLFTQEEEKNPIVILKDVKFQELETLLEFMYCGEVKIPEDRLKSFLDFAESLQIRGVNRVAKSNHCSYQQLRSSSATVSRDENSETYQQRNVHSNSYEQRGCERAQVTGPKRKRKSSESCQGEARKLHVTNFPIIQSPQTTSLQHKECAVGIQTRSSNVKTEPSFTMQHEFEPEDNFFSNEEDPLDLDVVVIKEQSDDVHSEPDVDGVDDGKSIEDTFVSDFDVHEDEAVSVPCVQNEENDYPVIDISYDEISHPPKNTSDPESPAKIPIVQEAPAPTEHDNKRPRRGCNRAMHETRERCGEGDRVAQEEQEADPLGVVQAAGGKGHNCAQCSKSFPALALLQKHVLLQHKAEHSHRCIQCSKTFGSSKDLEVHMTTHACENPYECGVCKASFSKYSALSIHMRIHDKRRFECVVCQARFINQCQLTAHKQRHLEEGPFKCDVCKATFTQRPSLAIHMRSHERERPFKCNECEACFSERDHLTQHEQEHAVERQYHCAVCRAGFSTPDHLAKHEKTHREERPFQCRVCKVRFKRNGHLAMHSRMHPGETPL